MQNLKALSDSELISNLQQLVAEERRITLEVLKHLQEVEHRQLFARENYSSLFDWCVRKLGYQDSAAVRRIDAMRLMTKVPELESKIESGSVKLSQLCQIQSFLRIEKKKVGKSYSTLETLDLVASLEGASTRQTERKLLAQSPVYQEYRETSESIRPVSNKRTELKVIVDEETLRLLEEAKSLLAHNRDLNPSMNEIFKKALTTLISGKKKTKQAEIHRVPDQTLEDSPSAPNVGMTASSEPPLVLSASPSSSPPQVTTSKRTRYISVKEKGVIFTRAQNRCEYLAPNGKRCESRHALEIHHVIPFAHGGTNQSSNLKVYCRVHNAAQGRWDFPESAHTPLMRRKVG